MNSELVDNPLLMAFVLLGIIVFSVLAVVFAWYHWRRRHLLDSTDFIIRWPLVGVFALVATGLVFYAIGLPAEWRIPPLVGAGVLPAVGMTQLLWWDFHPNPRRSVMSPPIHDSEEIPMTTVPVDSTKQLVPDGVRGYSKAIAGLVTLLVEAVTPFIAFPDNVSRIIHIVVAVLGVLAIYQVPNAVKQIEVATPPTPAANLDLDDEPGRHAAE